MTRRFAAAAAVAGTVVLFDQLTKHLVADRIKPGETERLTPFLSLVHTTNKGIAFGIDPGGSALPAVAVALALIALALYLMRATSRLLWLPGGLIVGGAIGNLIDRLSAGAVTDFIQLPLGWPPFNVADSAITVGVAILVVLSLRGASHPVAAAKKGAAPTDA